MSDAVSNNVHLDRLQDHDLLVRIATRLDNLPCASRRDEIDDLDKRTGDVEQTIAGLKVQGGVLAALATAISSLIGVFVKP